MRAAFLHSSSCSCIWSLLKSWCTSSLLTSIAVTEMTEMINMWTSSPPCFSTGTLTIAHTAHRLRHIHRCIKTVQYAHPSVPACSECCAWECVIVCAKKAQHMCGIYRLYCKKKQVHRFLKSVFLFPPPLCFSPLRRFSLSSICARKFLSIFTCSLLFCSFVFISPCKEETKTRPTGGCSSSLFEAWPVVWCMPSRRLIKYLEDLHTC